MHRKGSIGASDRTTPKVSAGLLLYRVRSALEVLLVRPGGPYWRGKDDGAWTVPKGEIGEGETAVDAARREFTEETGYAPKGETVVALGSLRQAGGKEVHVWAIEEDWDAERLVSNTFEMEWPPRSGKRAPFPEVDRAAWFDISMARRKILKSQVPFLDRLERLLPKS